MQDTKNFFGGGKITNGYSVKVQQFTTSAEEKLKSVGGEIFQSISEEKIPEA